MSHLTYEQRYSIEVSLQMGESKSYIAKKLHVDKSVIYREIRRNMDKRSGIYHCDQAQRKYQARLKQKPKHRRFDDALKTIVNEYLLEDYSPEQIAGVLKKEGQKQFLMSVFISMFGMIRSVTGFYINTSDGGVDVIGSED